MSDQNTNDFNSALFDWLPRCREYFLGQSLNVVKEERKYLGKHATLVWKLLLRSSSQSITTLITLQLVTIVYKRWWLVLYIKKFPFFSYNTSNLRRQNLDHHYKLTKKCFVITKLIYAENHTKISRYFPMFTLGLRTSTTSTKRGLSPTVNFKKSHEQFPFLHSFIQRLSNIPHSTGLSFAIRERG